MSDARIYVGGAGKVRIRKWEIVSSIQYNGIIQGLDIALLRGLVYGHPNFEDGEEVISSPIVEINLLSRSIKTYSGRHYHLEDPHPDWIEWLKDNNRTDYLKALFPN